MLTTRAGEDKDKSMKSWSARLVGAALAVQLAMVPWVAGGEPPKPGPEDRCAVCGMYVAKYPNWVAAVVFSDGARKFFDGPKDLFRYLLNMSQFEKARDISIVQDVFVTDYYTTQMVDAKTSYFITGSDVIGPMGSELLAISNHENAVVFLKDHRGEEILKFDQITADKIPR